MGEAKVNRRMVRAAGAIGLALLLALSAWATAASAAPLSMTFTEDRANVGVQLSDAALFAPPAVAPLDAQIGPGGESITAGVLQVPQFATHITEPIDANVTVDFDIGVITGTFTEATGALSLSGQAGGTLTSEGEECTVSTTPSPLILSTSENSGGKNPRSGSPFAHGLTGSGAIAGQWTDMQATPVNSGDTKNVNFCSDVETRIGGPGGIWLVQKGDVVPPSAPQLISTDPASPGSSATPRIRGAAEAGSTVRVYSGATCAGAPVSSGSAAELASPGLRVDVGEGITAIFSATATDPAGNTSACSESTSYTHELPGCVVPKLVGKKRARAKAALTAAGCKLGTVHKPKPQKGKGRRPLVVKSSSPAAGARSTSGAVDITLGPKPRKARH